MSIQVTKEYERERERLIKTWNAGIAVKREIHERYGEAKLKIVEILIRALNKMINILLDSGRAETVNHALMIIVSDDDFRNRCTDFPKSPRGLAAYIDDETSRRVLQNRMSKKIQSLRHQKLEQCSDFELFESRGLDIRPYNIWSLNMDKRFGTSHPGGIPAGIVFNTLYFYTKPGDLVVDPMAGGGVVGDCCYEVHRRYLMYDINPTRPDIEKYDMSNGLPKECQSAELLFWDPPYYKRKESSYGPQSISALSRESYFQFFNRFLRNVYDLGINKVAFLMAEDSGTYKERPIYLFDYIKIFERQRWNLLDRISCNGSMEQISGPEIKEYREKKLIYGLARDLIIFKRGESK